MLGRRSQSAHGTQAASAFLLKKVQILYLADLVVSDLTDTLNISLQLVVLLLRFERLQEDGARAEDLGGVLFPAGTGSPR